MAPALTCPACDKVFSRRFSLVRHLQNVHPRYEHNIKKRNTAFICPICKEALYSSEQFESHVSTEHKITIKKENLRFPDITSFYKWKNQTEVAENASFIKKTSSKQVQKQCSTTYFKCQRSGFFTPKGQGKRKLKMQGSSKIEGYCPAGIKTLYSENGSVLVEYISTHVGHKTELAHLKLTFEERKDIAEKIALKIPYDDILDKIWSSIGKETLKRKHLLTKHDLYNIETEFSFYSKAIQHPNDALSVEVWVQNEQASSNNCVLLYKPQGKRCHQYPKLRKDDFVLGIMTTIQLEMLNKFGPDCLCIGGTHITNEFGFELISVIVVDDMRQGFPCAFFICNKLDEDTFQLFFRAIKQKTGTIKVNVFMSDISNAFYDAWVAIMGPVKQRFFSTFHVDLDWREHLTQIRDTQEKNNTYKKIQKLLVVTDKSRFLSKLDAITTEMCQNEVTEDFGTYFQSCYSRCYELWAYCCRSNPDINTNLHLQRLHRTLQRIFLGENFVKRLDEIIHVLMQMVKDKTFDDTIVFNKCNITKKFKKDRTSLKMRTNTHVKEKKSLSEVKIDMPKTEDSTTIIIKDEVKVDMQPYQESTELTVKNEEECLHLADEVIVGNEAAYAQLSDEVMVDIQPYQESTEHIKLNENEEGFVPLSASYSIDMQEYKKPAEHIEQHEEGFTPLPSGVVIDMQEAQECSEIIIESEEGLVSLPDEVFIDMQEVQVCSEVVIQNEERCETFPCEVVMNMQEAQEREEVVQCGEGCVPLCEEKVEPSYFDDFKQLIKDEVNAILRDVTSVEELRLIQKCIKRIPSKLRGVRNSSHKPRKLEDHSGKIYPGRNNTKEKLKLRGTTIEESENIALEALLQASLSK